MAKVPNAERAEVPDAKLKQYLLDPDHKEGGPKAAFFLSYGFTRESPELLRTALLAHVLDADATVQKRPAVHYLVTDRIVSPDGRNPRVRSVWRIADGDGVPGWSPPFRGDAADV